MPACGTPGRKRGHHREPVDPTIALTHTVDAIRIHRPAVMAASGQTLPSGGRSTNDRSRTVSGSPSVESRASAQRPIAVVWFWREIAASGRTGDSRAYECVATGQGRPVLTEGSA